MLPTCLRVLEVCVLFAICSTGPGLYFLRGKTLAPAERAAAAFGLSNLFVGGAVFGIWLTGLPNWAYYLVAVASAAALWQLKDELVGLWRDSEVRGLIGAYGLLAAWLLAGVALIRCYSGGGWSGDWLEQYERCKFFLKHEPNATRFLDIYSLPMRPPLLNLLGTQYLATVGFHYSVFQTVCALLSAGMIFPAWLFARMFAGGRAFPAVVLLALLAFNPALVENGAYPWAKLPAATFAALGVWFYLTGWQQTDSPRIRLSALLLSAAVVAHYSSLPIVLFVGGHFALKGSQRFSSPSDEMGWMARLAAFVVGPWIVWSLYAFGAAGAFGGENYSDTGKPAPFFENIGTALANVFYLVIPHFLRGADLTFLGEQGSWSSWRDDAFLVYQTNGVFIAGTAGAIALWFVIRRQWRAMGAPDDTATFWIGFAAAPLVCAVPMAGGLDLFGLARASMLPAVIVALAALAGTFETWPLWLKRTLVAGLAFDFVFGVALQVLIESRVFGDEIPGQPGLFPNMAEPTSSSASFNWMQKTTGGVRFLGDFLRPAAGPICTALTVGIYFTFKRLLALVWKLPESPPENVEPVAEVVTEGGAA